MKPKRFNFTVENMGTRLWLGWHGCGLTMEDAWRQAAVGLVQAGIQGAGVELEMFRFTIENTRTHETTGILGQGCTVAEAWSDAMKLTREPFRPKADGKARDNRGLTILLPPRLGDTYAVGTAVSRSIDSFQSDETFAEERERLRLEAQEKAIEEARAAA